MKKLIFIGFLLLVSHISHSQSKSAIGIRSGVLISNTVGDVIDFGGGGNIFNPLSSQPIVLRDDATRRVSSIYYGISYTRRLGIPLSLSIELNKYDLSTDYNNSISSGSTTLTVVQDLDVEVLNIPLYATYTLDKFIQIDFSAGVYINSVLSASYFEDVAQIQGTSIPVTNTVLYDLKGRINDRMLGMIFKTAFSKKLADKLSAGVELFYNRDFSYLDKKENRDAFESNYARFHAYGAGILFKYSI